MASDLERIDRLEKQVMMMQTHITKMQREIMNLHEIMRKQSRALNQMPRPVTNAVGYMLPNN